MAEPSTTYNNLREAYCAVRRVAAEKFEGKVLRASIYRHALPYATFLALFEKDYFQKDLETIRTLGNARSRNEFNRALDEVSNMLGVERSLRRRVLAVRVAAHRLAAIFEPLVPLLAQGDAPTEPLKPAIIRAAPEQKEGSPHSIRRLSKIHGEVVQGRSLAESVREGGFEDGEFRRLLSEVKEGRKDLEWLHKYAGQLDDLARLEAENDRLKRVTAELSTRLIGPA